MKGEGRVSKTGCRASWLRDQRRQEVSDEAAGAGISVEARRGAVDLRRAKDAEIGAVRIDRDRPGGARDRGLPAGDGNGLGGLALCPRVLRPRSAPDRRTDPQLHHQPADGGPGRLLRRLLQVLQARLADVPPRQLARHRGERGIGRGERDALGGGAGDAGRLRRIGVDGRRQLLARCGQRRDLRLRPARARSPRARLARRPSPKAPSTPGRSPGARSALPRLAPGRSGR